MSNLCTLWQLLNDQKTEITIPMIQRDYAQGRRGKEHIRSGFLNSIKECLCDGADMTLDFVYGNTENGRFLPLDGQQRLTTLWLVHWYLAFRIGKLRKTDVRETLKRFSYQTRTSSIDFCENLCDKMVETDLKISNVAEHIKKQTWFYAEWLQDPTINAMLRTISGDKYKKENAEIGKTEDDGNDHIEGVFKDQDATGLVNCWNNLVVNPKITFRLMVIGTQQLPISDDLYIKMNARGKSLSDFENFKADLVSHIQEIPVTKDKLYYAQQLDGNWTDVFWNNRKNAEGFDGSIDSMFFLFINRFVLNQHCLQPNVSANHYDAAKNPAPDTDSNRKDLQKKFCVLYGSGLGKGKNPNDDSLIEYKDFEIYRPYMTPENLDKMDRIFDNLKDYADTIDGLHLSSLDENEDVEEITSQTLYFLPYYKDNILQGTQLKERIYFHAICLFLDKPANGKIGDWMRLVRNLVENADVENIENMIGCLREINDLGMMLRERNWDIYRNIASYELKSSVSRLEDQWKEELKKAERIQELPEAAAQKLEAAIHKAEDHAFFKGTIRFLFTGPNGETDWDNFDTKLQRANYLFNDNLVDPDTVKEFLGMFKTFDHLPDSSYLFTNIGYNNRQKCWKRDILCNPKTTAQVHNFLLNKEPLAEGIYKDFLESRAVARICKQDRKNFRYMYSRDYGVHRENGQKEGIYISPLRLKKNKLFLSLVSAKEFQLVDDVDLGNGFLWGKEILFCHNGQQYSWFVEWGGKNKIRSAAFKDKEFEWTNDMSKEDLLEKL